MPTPQETQLKRMCHQSETLVQAQVLLHTANARTRPGSGHELGQGASGLPAICAYLASAELGNDDVSEKVAQAASCLAPKIFAATLATVRSVLRQRPSSPSKSPTKGGADRRRSSRHRTAVDYRVLVADHQIKLAGTVVGWLEDAERSLDSAPAFRSAHEPDSAPVKCAVFFWVCQVLELTRVSRKLMTTRYEIPGTAFDELVGLLDDTCTPLRERIVQEVNDLKKSTRRKGDASPTKPPAVTTPRKPRDRADAEPVTPSRAQLSPKKPSLKRPMDAGTPQLDTPRRKVAFSASTPSELDEAVVDTDDALPSPSKRPRIAPPAAARSADALLSASTSRLTLETAAASEDISAPATPSRRTPRRQRTTADTSTPARTPTTPRRAAKAPARPLSPSPQPSDAADAREPQESESDSDGALPPPRRYRPAFLDRAQWATRDPRAEREWTAARRAAKRAEATWGHPFEHWRPVPQDINMEVGPV